jgi:hypothetical protein
MAAPTTAELYSGAAFWGGTPLADLSRYLADTDTFSHATMDAKVVTLRDALLEILTTSSNSGAILAIITQMHRVATRLHDPQYRDLAHRLAIIGAELGSRALARAAARNIATIELTSASPRAIELRLGFNALVLGRLFDLANRGQYKTLASRLGCELLAETGYIRPVVHSIPILPDYLIGLAQVGADPEEPATAAAFGIRGGLSALLDALRSRERLALDRSRLPSTAVLHELIAIASEEGLDGPAVWRMAGLAAGYLSPEDSWRPASCALQMLTCPQHQAAVAAAAGWLHRYALPLAARLFGIRSGPVIEPNSVRSSIEAYGIIVLKLLREDEDSIPSSASVRAGSAASTLDILEAPTLVDGSIQTDFEVWLSAVGASLRDDIACALEPYRRAPWGVGCALAGDRLFAKAADLNRNGLALVHAAGRLHFYSTLTGVARPETIARILAAHAIAEEAPPPCAGMWMSALAWVSLAAQPTVSATPLKDQLKAYLGIRTQIHEGNWIESGSCRDAALDLIWSQPRETVPPPMDYGAVPARGDTTRSVVVFPSLGRMGRSVKEVEQQFSTLIGQPLPIASIPPTPQAYQTLAARAPHLETVIRSALREFGTSGGDHGRPLLFVGRPGCGKTDLCISIAQVLGIPLAVFPCGGITDSGFGGTGRHWSTSRPSFPISHIAATKIANPAILLDEIEKAGTCSHNGSLADVIVGLIEPSTARIFWDPYLEAETNVSFVRWLLTANSVQNLHPALLDRCKVLHCPEPGPEHLPALVHSVISSVVADNGLDERWATSITPAAYDMIEGLWRGGSLRRLKRTVEVVLTQLERARPH